MWVFSVGERDVRTWWYRPQDVLRAPDAQFALFYTEDIVFINQDMKVYRRHEALIVESESIMKLIGCMATGRYGYERAKGAAFYPFLFVRREEFATPLIINHERIHFRQQIETLFIGLFLLRIIETVYARLVLKLQAPNYNLYLAAEQEAYRNQHDMQYLNGRKWFSLFKYIRDKRQLTYVEGKAPEVVVGIPW